MAVHNRIPFLLRFLSTGSRWSARFTRFETILRTEIAWAWTRPERRHQLNLDLYNHDADYCPGGKWFEQGLFPWEEEAFQNAPFPKTGRILLGGAGGGREIATLIERGFEVIAFEPSPTLVEVARKVAGPSKRHRVFQVTYEEFIRSIETNEGELAHLVQRQTIDGVILGWGSFPHVATAADRARLLKTLHRVAPDAPVVLSFFRRDTIERARLEAMAPYLRTFFRLLGAPGRCEDGDLFSPELGFVHRFSPEEIKALARECSYDVARGDISPYPHAVLTPQNANQENL